uniref:Antimicrobial peptide n=1 Tax=Mesocestoides corti TaxID=53468 RepID=A0A5K3F0D1_MESCO
MRTWILTALLVIALVACFEFTEAKPATELEKAPSTSPAGSEQTGGKKKRRRRPGRHSKDGGERRSRGRFQRKTCSKDSDCRRGKKCVPTTKGVSYCRRVH